MNKDKASLIIAVGLTATGLLLIGFTLAVILTACGEYPTICMAFTLASGWASLDLFDQAVKIRRRYKGDTRRR